MIGICMEVQKILGNGFADFKCFDELIVEVKTSNEGIQPEHVAQLLNYLKVSRSTVGLLVNFGKRKLEYQRFILTAD